MGKVCIGVKLLAMLSAVAAFTSSCSKTVPCPSQRAVENPIIIPAQPELPQIAPPQAVSLKDAKRVFAAHDCCGRYLNTEFFRVGAVRARGRVFTIFHMVFVNPANYHGGEGIAILDGMKLLGTYEIYDTEMRLRDGQILFECSSDAREHNATECDEAGFQSIDLNQPQLPKTRIINGQISELNDSI